MTDLLNPDLEELSKGDFWGHPFHGNQWVRETLEGLSDTDKGRAEKEAGTILAYGHGFKADMSQGIDRKDKEGAFWESHRTQWGRQVRIRPPGHSSGSALSRLWRVEKTGPPEITPTVNPESKKPFETLPSKEDPVSFREEVDALRAKTWGGNPPEQATQAVPVVPAKVKAAKIKNAKARTTFKHFSSPGEAFDHADTFLGKNKQAAPIGIHTVVNSILDQQLKNHPELGHEYPESKDLPPERPQPRSKGFLLAHLAVKHPEVRSSYNPRDPVLKLQDVHSSAHAKWRASTHKHGENGLYTGDISKAGDLPGHQFRGNQWQKFGSMSPQAQKAHLVSAHGTGSVFQAGGGNHEWHAAEHAVGDADADHTHGDIKISTGATPAEKEWEQHGEQAWMSHEEQWPHHPEFKAMGWDNQIEHLEAATTAGGHALQVANANDVTDAHMTDHAKWPGKMGHFHDGDKAKSKKSLPLPATQKKLDAHMVAEHGSDANTKYDPKYTGEAHDVQHTAPMWAAHVNHQHTALATKKAAKAQKAGKPPFTAPVPVKTAAGMLKSELNQHLMEHHHIPPSPASKATLMAVHNADHKNDVGIPTQHVHGAPVAKKAVKAAAKHKTFSQMTQQMMENHMNNVHGTGVSNPNPSNLYVAHQWDHKNLNMGHEHEVNSSAAEDKAFAAAKKAPPKSVSVAQAKKTAPKKSVPSPKVQSYIENQKGKSLGQQVFHLKQYHGMTTAQIKAKQGQGQSLGVIHGHAADKIVHKHSAYYHPASKAVPAKKFTPAEIVALAKKSKKATKPLQKPAGFGYLAGEQMKAHLKQWHGMGKEDFGTYASTASLKTLHNKMHKDAVMYAPVGGGDWGHNHNIVNKKAVVKKGGAYGGFGIGGPKKKAPAHSYAKKSHGGYSSSYNQGYGGSQSQNYKDKAGEIQHLAEMNENKKNQHFTYTHNIDTDGMTPGEIYLEHEKQHADKTVKHTHAKIKPIKAEKAELKSVSSVDDMTEVQLKQHLINAHGLLKSQIGGNKQQLIELHKSDHQDLYESGESQTHTHKFSEPGGKVVTKIELPAKGQIKLKTTIKHEPTLAGTVLKDTVRRVGNSVPKGKHLATNDECARLISAQSNVASQSKAGVAELVASGMDPKHDAYLIDKIDYRDPKTNKYMHIDVAKFLDSPQGKDSVWSIAPSNSSEGPEVELIQLEATAQEKKLLLEANPPRPGASGQGYQGSEPTYYASGDDPRLRIALRAVGVSDMISSWAGSSNDDDPRSLALQEEAEKEFGLQGTHQWKVNHYTKQRMTKIGPEQRAMFRNFLRTQYELTQKLLKTAKVDYIRLYRGFRWYNNPAPSWWNKENANGSLNPVLRPMSSTAFTPEEAENFGNPIDMIVPASRILSCASTGFACQGEDEFVILAGPGEANKYTEDDTDSNDYLSEDEEENPYDNIPFLDMSISDKEEHLLNDHGLEPGEIPNVTGMEAFKLHEQQHKHAAGLDITHNHGYGDASGQWT